MTNKNNDLINRLKKTGSLDNTAILSESKFFNEKDMVQTEIPALNLALSGSFDGGLTPGLTFIAGPSATFKTNMALKMCAAYQKKYPESMVLFYDSEFGATPDYMESMGIDNERVLHIPITDIEELKFDISAKLQEIKRGDKVIILVDSIGNLASKKEVEDALNEKSVADMSRAKALKSIFRIVTPHLTTKDIPMVAINHTYQEIGMFPKTIMGGGTGGFYSAQTIFIISKSQEKEGTELNGFLFNINIEKSRFVRPKARIPIRVTFDEGVDKYSGLFDIALDMGFIENPKQGWYCLKGSDKNFRRADANPMLEDLLVNDEFKKSVASYYKL